MKQNSWYSIFIQQAKDGAIEKGLNIDHFPAKQWANHAEFCISNLETADAENMLTTSIPTLFHGTDYRIATMDEEERTRFRVLFEDLGNDLYVKYYKNIKDEPDFVSRFISTDNYSLGASLLYACNQWESKIKRSIVFASRVNDIYLTTDPQKANNYAYQARYFGEIGMFFYFMYKGLKFIKDVKIVCMPLEEELIEQFLSFCEATPQPVVFVVDNVNPKSLFCADIPGAPRVTLSSVHSEVNYLYTQKLNLDDDKKFLLKPLDA